MKKLLYIGHAYHNKTKSTQFLQDIFKSEYEIVKFDYDPYSDSENKFNELSNLEFDVVVLFQIMPQMGLIKKNIKFRNIAFFPMYDGTPPLTDSIWYEYKDCNIINFSKTLHKECKKYGLSSYYIQYFPCPKKVEDFGDEKSVFLWQRINKINPNIVDKVIGFENVNKFYHHQAPDPGQVIIKTFPMFWDKVEVSTWFDTKEEMEKYLQKSSIYFAPRELEGIGMSFLDAMAMGRCVVAPDYPTANEYIKDGVNGYLYNLENTERKNLKNIKDIQKGTIEFIKNGYETWRKEKHKILEWIVSDVAQNRDDELIKRRLMPCEVQKKNLKISITYLKKKTTPTQKIYYLLGFLPIYKKKRKIK